MPILTADVNWRDKVSLREVYRTEIVEALSLAEERQQKYPRCLYGIDYTTTLLTPREQGTLRKQFELADDMPFGVPMWTEKAALTSAASSGETEVVTENLGGLLFGAFGHVLLWEDMFTWEVVQLAFVGLNRIFLGEALENDWPVGTVIVPVAFGWTPRPEFQALNDERSDVKIKFEERWTGLSHQGALTPPPALPDPDPEYDSACRDTVRFTWGDQSENVQSFRIEIGDSAHGPWTVYIDDISNEATDVLLNNYFGGEKWLRISAGIQYEYSVGDLRTYFVPFTVKKPTAAVVAPPTLEGITNVAVSSAALNYIAPSGVDGSDVEVVSVAENALVDSVAYIEVRARFEHSMETSWDGLKQILSLSHPDPEVEFKVTVDGSTPDGSTPDLVIDSTANNIGAYRTDFGLIVRCRASKDGCLSPETCVFVDLRRFSKAQAVITGKTKSLGTSCDFPDEHGTESGASCEVIWGGVDAFKFAQKGVCCTGMTSGATSSTYITRAVNDEHTGVTTGLWFGLIISYSRFIAESVNFGRLPLWDDFPPGLHCYAALFSDGGNPLRYAGQALTGPSGVATGISNAGSEGVALLVQAAGECHELLTFTYDDFHVLLTREAFP